MNDELFEELKSQILTFVASQQKLESQLDTLQKENDMLKAQLAENSIEADSFQNQQKLSKLVGSKVREGEDKANIKRLLNGYIKEIDRCIMHLKQ